MPVPTETLWNIKRLNVVFAASSVLALGSTGWMLWHDYDRPWRHTQTSFFNLRSAMAHFDVLQYETPQEQARRQKLQDALARAEADLATDENREKEADLQAREEQLAGQAQGVAITYGNRNAELQVKLFNLEESATLHGHDDPRTAAIREDYERSAREVEALKARQDGIEDQLRDIKMAIKAFYRQRTEAQKALAAYDKGLNDARRLDAMYGPGPKRAIFNLPGIDFLAPSGIPGRQEVQQVFMKNIRFNYNFLDSYVTDRCLTCHVGIDNPALTIESYAARTEAALKTERAARIVEQENLRLMQALTRRLAEADVSEFIAGGPPTDPAVREKFVQRMVAGANDYLAEIRRPGLEAARILAALPTDKPLSRGMIEDEIARGVQAILEARPPVDPDGRVLPYAKMNEAQKMAYVASLTAAINLYLEREGRPPVDFRKELRAHPHLDLYVSPTSPHPLKSVGCTVCHEGSGQETDFVFAAHTPKNKHEEHEWAEKYYVREMGVPLATFHLVEEYWERPMLLPGYTSASCRKCHQQAYDLERAATAPVASARRLVEGRDLFTSVGCINCHNVEGLTDSRRVGTDLTHVGDKLSRGFIERWVEYPGDFRPSTLMPHFFRQENNLPSSANEFDPDPVLRSKVEIAAMTHYLLTFSRPLPEKDWYPLPEGLAGDAGRGEKLFTSIGCLACHANLAAKDPLDGQGRTIGERWITTDLVMRAGLSEEEAGRQFSRMSRNDQVRYALANFNPARREEAIEEKAAEELAAEAQGRDPDPKKTYVPPALTRDAPELSGLGTKLIPDGADAGQAAHATRWLYNWLRDPRHYSSYTKMPRMFRDDYYWASGPAERRQKNDQDILDVAAFLLSLRNDEFQPGPLEVGEAEQAETRRLIMALLTGQNTASVSQRMLNDEKDAPSDPWGRLSAAVVAQAGRSFGEGDAGRREVAEIIARNSPGLFQRQQLWLGMKMISHYGCYSCHTIAGFEDATRPGTDLTLWAQKFMSQLDFAFYSPVFEEELLAQPEVFARLYPASGEFEHLVRDTGENPEHEILHNHASFAYHKLRNPRIWDRRKTKRPYEKLKMPNFFFNEEEARSLTTFLLSLKDSNVFRAVQVDYDATPAGKIARGRALARELNCIGCHNIEGNEANLHQYYSRDPALSDTDPTSRRFMPPLLWGEGAKVQFPWLFTFLNNVEMLRPWLLARMPSFHLTREQSTTLVEYFAGLAQYESKVLDRHLDPVARHLREVHGAAPSGQSAESAAAWFLEPKLSASRDFLRDYGARFEQERAANFEPGDKTDPAEIVSTVGPSYEKMVQRAGFLAGLFSVKYPFSDPRVYHTDEERYKLGEAFFIDQKCLACHVAGDPTAPGTGQDIKAPNFALAHRRLRYDWVLDWLEDPQAIQPGANMPQIFQGGSAYAMLPQADREKLEARFGRTVEEQSRLMVDFLFNLGERRATVVMPAAPAGAPQAEPPAQQAEFDFDSGGTAPTSQPAKTEFDF